jgi:arginine decarboxylase
VLCNKKQNKQQNLKKETTMAKYLQDPSWSYTGNVSDAINLTPRFLFLTKGVGVHKSKLRSFEEALRHAGIANQNLVYVSSIFPPNCQLIKCSEGIEYIKKVSGSIRFAVMARIESNEPHRLIAASIGLAKPKDPQYHGYISEYHGYGIQQKIAEDSAEDLAAEMLAETLGVQFDPDTAWNEKEKVFKVSGKILFSRNITQTALANKDGKWTTALACAVFIL